MKLVKLSVEVTEAQLQYLKGQGYMIRAKPEEMLIACAFAFMERDVGDFIRGDAFNMSLLNWVVERRVPVTGVDCNFSSFGDAGQLWEPALKKRRLSISDDRIGQGRAA